MFKRDRNHLASGNPKSAMRPYLGHRPMSRAIAQFRRILIFVHRWMGVPFCLLFLMWFLSGIAMMYCDYPMVSRQDQISHSPALDPAAIKLSPEQAYGSLQRREMPQS